MFGNGKGLFGGNPMAMTPPQQPKAPQQGGIGGFLQRNQMPLAQLSDVFLRLGGGQGNPMLQRLQDQQDMEQMQGFRTQLSKQQQDAQMQQWIAQQDYARNNPEPRAPDAFDIALQRGGIDPNSPEGQQMYRDRAASMARDPNDQFVTVTIPGVGTYAGPQSGLPSFAGTAPQRPVGRLTPIAPQMGAQQPQMTVTPRELDALVRRFGPAEVQARIDSGIVAVRNN